MFRRLRRFFDGKPLVGDRVAVLSGPYRGRPGTIIAIDQGGSTVYIDNDPEGDWARYLLDQKR